MVKRSAREGARGAAALAAAQLAAALGEHQDGVGRRTQRVGDVVAVLERERRPQLVADLGEEHSPRGARLESSAASRSSAAASAWRAWRMRSGAAFPGISLRV